VQNPTQFASQADRVDAEYPIAWDGLTRNFKKPA